MILLYKLIITGIILYMKFLDDLLERAGLSRSERIVYLAGRDKELKTAELVKATKLPRSTVTAAIDQLELMGLCRAEPLDRKTNVYTMLPVQNLNAHLGQSAHSLHALMDEVATFTDASETSRPQTATGQEGVQKLLELALRCKSRKWHIIATKQNPVKAMSKEYAEYFKSVRNERQIEAYSLWDTTGRKTMRLHELMMRKPRFIPKPVKEVIPGFVLLFDDSVLMISGKKNPSAYLVQDAAITETIRILFEMAWYSVRPQNN